MNTPSSYDSTRLRQLTSAVMDGIASESEQRELTEILRNSLAAQDEYLALVDLHAAMATELPTLSTDDADNIACDSVNQATKSIVDPDSHSVDGADAELRRRWWTSTAGFIALAASVMIAVALYNLKDENQEANDLGLVTAETQQGFVTIAQLTNAEWKSEQLAVGGKVGASTLRLTDGFARLEFDTGVEVTLEGPAEFELTDVATTSLKSGLLTATVPPGAEGFTVNTPNAEVIDLGTSFGIDLREDGFANVSVFDGEVEVLPRETEVKRLLTEGESVRIGADYRIEDVGFDAARFEKLWPIASGIVGSTSTIRFIPPWPRQIRFVQSDEDIFIATEGHAVELSNDLDVNISQPGKYTSIDQLTPATIQPGERVRSYLLHYSPQTQRGPRRAQRVTGSITFDRPVRGLIVLHEELLASSRRFTFRSAGEGNSRRELNLNDDASGDRVTLSEDGKTVTFDLVSPGRSSDLARVIVEGTGRNRPNKSRPPKRRNRNRRQ
ncbi:MAG: FecR domain-containing protein [Planctomycetota bacterium]